MTQHITHIQGGLSPEHGGPTQSLANYCRGQVAMGHKVSVWVLEGFPKTSPAVQLQPPIQMHVFQTGFPAKLGRSTEMSRQLRKADSPDIYHLHGAWFRAMHYGAVEAQRRKKPYVLEVMGMYEPWQLRHKWVRKSIARWWFQDQILQGAACLHVNSKPEADSIRALGFKAPIAIIPVGVDVEKIKEQQSVLPTKSPWPELVDRPFILYLSRLHPKKGLDLLIRAYALTMKAETGKLKPETGKQKSEVRSQESESLSSLKSQVSILQSEVSSLKPQVSSLPLLVIAGTGEESYVKECRQLAEQLKIADQCLWVGHVNETQKSWLFSHAHCYVLPTQSENFGNVVAEALAHGTPVITTRNTPWKDLEKHNCGWIVDYNEDELCNALHLVLNLDKASREKMGSNGERLVNNHYSLQSVLENINAVYQWLVNGKSAPDCVEFC
jgi:glycosyltransferase involved in cell wall biosynthesis